MHNRSSNLIVIVENFCIKFIKHITDPRSKLEIPLLITYVICFSSLWILILFKIFLFSFLSPEEQQQFETEAAVGSFPKTVSNVIDTGSVSQDYLTNKTELDRQCNELMVSSYDSSVGKNSLC